MSFDPQGPDDALDHRPTRTTSWQAALDITVRSGLSPADQNRILALPYPIDHHDFWRVLADMGLTQERLMDRMGASL